MKATHFIAIYETDRAYGGPEEGGWWFDTGELLEDEGVWAFDSWEAANAALPEIEAMVARRNKDEKRREPGSVLCDGWLAAQIVEGVPEKEYPKHRPRYE